MYISFYTFQRARLISLYNSVYYIDTDIYARFFSCEKPFRDMFLTNVIQSES